MLIILITQVLDSTQWTVYTNKINNNRIIYTPILFLMCMTIADINIISFNNELTNFKDYKQTDTTKVSSISTRVASGEENSIVNSFCY